VNRWRRLAGIAALMALAGCATTREYPRCYLFRAPSQEELAVANDAIEGLFQKIVRAERFSLAKDWAVLETTSNKHSSVRRLWPEVGCVNLRREEPYNSEPNDKWIVARCQEYLGSLLSRKSVKPPERPTEVAARFNEFACH